MSPEPGMMYPGTTPSTPTPMLTLQDIQREALSRGLFRSNSAAARLMAMNQLTRNEHPDPSLSSPSPGPRLGLGRNNTVAGGERNAARRLMMGRLKERLKEKEAEAAEQTSAGEDQPPPPPKRRSRRRSRRASNRSTVVDDRELSSTTSPNTPVNGPTPLPLEMPPFDGSSTPGRMRKSSIERQRDETLMKLMGGSPTFERSPLEMRGVVIEEDDEQLSPPHRPFAPGVPPATPPRVDAIRATHASDSPSTMTFATGIGAPVYMSDSHKQPDVFPSSPFATPLKEQTGLEEEEDDMLLDGETQEPQGRRWTDAYERDISWSAEPGKSILGSYQ